MKEKTANGFQEFDVNIKTQPDGLKSKNFFPLKPFKKGDLFVYSLLLLLILTAFFIFIFPTFLSPKEVNAFSVERDGVVILTIDASKQNPLQISTQFQDIVEIQDENEQDKIIKIKIYSSSKKTGYNLLLFDANNGTVKIIESTCSDSKDCTFFPALKNSGSIYCAPHNLKIVPLFGDKLVPPIAG